MVHEGEWKYFKWEGDGGYGEMFLGPPDRLHCCCILEGFGGQGRGHGCRVVHSSGELQEHDCPLSFVVGNTVWPTMTFNLRFACILPLQRERELMEGGFVEKLPVPWVEVPECCDN